jgi:hypothetical protein
MEPESRSAILEWKKPRKRGEKKIYDIKADSGCAGGTQTGNLRGEERTIASVDSCRPIQAPAS